MSVEKDINVTCKSHTNRSEKDLYRIRPSNLSKQELEDLYFVLFESNINLKKAINVQQDEIKVLTTKVQRLTTQKPIVNRSRECCAKNIAIINEQKEMIADLRRVNERCADRIRLLNIKLCSAKQYLRHGPQNNLRCSKCCLAFNNSIKNSSMSALYTKRSEANLRTAATSCEYLDKVTAPVKLTQVVSTQTENNLLECEQNKCRTTTDDLKLKIDNLEKELTKTQDKYIQEINKLEKEMNRLRLENNQVKVERTAEQKQIQEFRSLVEKLRTTEEKCDELTGQLIIERGKVSELEMMLKTAERSKQVVDTIEEQLKNSALAVTKYTDTLLLEGSSNRITSDDSGYTEAKSQQYDKDRSLDQKILDQILNLKVELDSLKLFLKNDQKDTIKKQPVSFDSSQQNKLNNPKADIEVSSNKEAEQFEINLSYQEQDLSETTTDQTILSTYNKSKIPRLNKNLSTNAKNIKPDTKLDNSSQNDKVNANNGSNTKTSENKFSDNIENNEDENREINKEKCSLQSKILNTDLFDANKDDGHINNNNLSQEVITRENDKPTDININKINAKHNNKKSVKPYQNKVESPMKPLDTNETIKNVTNETKKEKDKIKKNKEVRDKEHNRTEVKRRMSYVIETKSNKQKLTKVASEDNIGSKTYSIPAKGKPLAASSPYNNGTYDVHTRRTSTDDTECEISSLTDLPREIYDRSPFDYISPGEERQTTISESFVTTTDYGSLSEGELPFTGRRSYDKIDIHRRLAETMVLEPVNVEETLRNISDEIQRCKRLLRGKTLPTPTLDAFPFNITL